MESPRPQWIEDLEKLEGIFDPDSTEEFIRLLGRQPGSEFMEAFRAHLPTKLILSIVADASAIISILHRLLKGRASTLWKFIEAGTVVCWAPAEQLDRDLDGKFEYLAKKLGIPVSRVREEWERRVGPRIRLDEVNAPPEVQVRLKAIRQRDPEDADYIALALVISAHGVFTMDKDIIENGAVRVLTIDKVVRIASVFKRGRLATTVQVNCACGTMLAGAVIVGLLVEGGKLLPSLIRLVPVPVWIGIAAGLVLLLLIPDVRAWALRRIAAVRRTLEGLWVKVREGILELMKVWGPVFSSMVRAQSEMEELLKSEPLLVKRKQSRRISISVPPAFGARIVECVKEARGPLRPIDILRQLFPRAAACDSNRLRRRISQVLSKARGIRKVGRGFYEPALATSRR